MLWLQLQHLKSKNPETRLQAVKGPADSHSPWSFKALAKAAQDEDSRVRADGAIAAVLAGREPVVTPVVDRLLAQFLQTNI
jgi:hypothetical protein